MKNYAITSGKFTTKGNFTGYNAIGERVHVHAAQMASLKWTKDEEVKFPFYAIGEMKKIGQLNEDNTPKTNADGTPVLVDRLTALSVFATKEQLVAAKVDNLTLDIEVAASVKASAEKAGLTKEQIGELVAF